MNIEFVDLKAQYISIKEEIDTAISNVIQDTAFIKGVYVNRFEQNFATKYGAKHCIGVANGTDAIYILLKMLGIKAGDEVITVANSWISTSETISQTGATPVFVDADEFFTIDASQIEAKITDKTKAILPVHLYGQMADMVTIKAICDKYKLYLIEDCAQSHFSELNGIRAGLWGDAATFSFFPGKNLGAYGDAGCIITNNDDIALNSRMYANHGAIQKHHHLIEGINSRLDGLQAAILDVKLKYILDWTQKRIEKAQYYDEILKDIPQILLPKVRPNTKHSFHLYVLLVEQREELISYLKDNGIPTFIHYPVPLPFMPAYKYLSYSRQDFPIVADNQTKILSIPIYPELTAIQQEFIANTIRKFYESNK